MLTASACASVMRAPPARPANFGEQLRSICFKQQPKVAPAFWQGRAIELLRLAGGLIGQNSDRAPVGVKLTSVLQLKP
jgi:hypothetical protein